MNTDVKLILIDETYDKLEVIREINEEAFPVGERVPIEKLLEGSKTGVICLYAIEDENKAVGFMVTVKSVHPKWMYLLFFAIDANCRGCNYGGRAIQTLIKEHSDKIFFGCIERLDPQAENYKQRVARERFYINNGFTISDVHFEIKDKMEKMTVILTSDSKERQEIIDRIAEIVCLLMHISEEHFFEVAEFE